MWVVVNKLLQETPSKDQEQEMTNGGPGILLYQLVLQIIFTLAHTSVLTMDVTMEVDILYLDVLGK
jgi:hypothetical protein